MFCFKPHCPQGSEGAKFPNEVTIVLKEMVLWNELVVGVKKPASVLRNYLVKMANAFFCRCWRHDNFHTVGSGLSICHTGCCSGTFKPIIRGQRRNKHQFSYVLPPTDLSGKVCNYAQTHLVPGVDTEHIYDQLSLKLQVALEGEKCVVYHQIY